MSSIFDPAIQPAHTTPDDRAAIVETLSPLTVREAGGEPVPAASGLVNWRLAVGDKVLTRRIGRELVVIACRSPRPTRGAVVSVAGGIATVNAEESLWDLSFVGDAPTIGAQVRILWDADGGTVLGPVGSATAAPNQPTDPPATGGQPITLDLRPTGWGTYRAGSAMPDEADRVAQGYWPGWAHLGAKSGLWVYGDVWGGIRGRTCQSLSITLARMPGIGVTAARPAHLRLHNHLHLPGNPAWVSDEFAGISIAAGAHGTFTLPAWWGTSIADGSAAGVGITYDGSNDYMALHGPDVQGSGTLHGTWH